MRLEAIRVESCELKCPRLGNDRLSLRVLSHDPIVVIDKTSSDRQPDQESAKVKHALTTGPLHPLNLGAMDHHDPARLHDPDHLLEEEREMKLDLGITLVIPKIIR